MSEAQNSQADGNKIIFPDFVELWKELYYKTEAACADAFKEFVSTDSFVKMLDQTLNQHLSAEKINRQNMDKLFEHSAFPSQKDLARIAELVISVEEKVDNLDYQLLDNINRMADSLLTTIALLEKNQQQLAAINIQNSELKTRLDQLQTQNSEMQHNIQELHQQNQLFNQHITDLAEQNAKLCHINSETKTELADIKIQNTRLKNQLTDIKKQITALNPKPEHTDDRKGGSVKKARRKAEVEQAE